MLKNKYLIQSYELTNPTPVMPEGLVNNRVYKNLELELKKPAFENIQEDYLIRIFKVYCVPHSSGGLLWEPQIWNLLTGEKSIDSDFLPPEKNKVLIECAPGKMYEFNYYENMLYENGHFKLKYTETVLFIFNDGQNIHEFMFPDRYGNQEEKQLFNVLKEIYQKAKIKQEKEQLEKIIQCPKADSKTQNNGFKI